MENRPVNNIRRFCRGCRRLLPAGAVVALLLAAPGIPAAAAETQDAAAASAAGAPAARAASKQGSVMLEGAAEPITLLLFERAFAPGSIGFSTYVPQDMVARSTDGSAARALRFIANFGGVMQEQAYLEVAFLPPSITQAQALAAVARSAPGGERPKRTEDVDRQFGWSLAEYSIAYRTKARSRVAGLAALGRHGDRYFTVTLHYPLEYGGGFVPRAALILQEWRWADTHAGL